MKKYIVYLIYLSAVIITACSTKKSLLKSSANPFYLKVMTYNIHHANPPSKNNFIDLDAIAKVIRGNKPDVVALQEVDVHTKRSGISINEAEVLAQKTEMHFYFAKAIDFEEGDYGIAILSKYPVSGTETVRLPTDSSTHGEHRVLALARIKIPGKRSIVFGCTHLDAQKKDINRLLQISAIVERLKKEKDRVIIAGDFNAEPSGKVIGVLDQYFQRTCTSSCGFTIPVINPQKTIDFIAYKPFEKFATVKHEVIHETYASDHLPVLATLEIKY